MFQLNELTQLVKKRKRVGRGGKRGGTSGKGHKGQKARSGGYVRIAFEGGQMPLFRRLPKRGFNNENFKKNVAIVNLQTLNDVFDNDSVVTKDLLRINGIIPNDAQLFVKILANGVLSKKLVVHADGFSKAAINMIKELGGEAKLN